MHKPITIKDIAKAVKVSITTVSKALNNDPVISQKTREMVQAYAKEHNYEKNRAAVGFKTGKNYTIGVILPEISEVFYSLAISGIGQEAINSGYNVIFSESHNNMTEEQKIVSMLSKSSIDGLIICLTKVSGYSIKDLMRLQRSGLPVVFFDRVPKDDMFYTVSVDLFHASMEIIDYLWAQGHKNIALIKGPQSLYTSVERMKGFMEGLHKKRIKANGMLFATTDLTIESTRKAMQEILSQEVKPTAVVAFNDYVALDAIQYIKEETPLEINKDICFVSYGNLPFTNYIENLKPVASIEQFPVEQGRLATRMLIDILNKKEIPEKKILIKGKLINHLL